MTAKRIEYAIYGFDFESDSKTGQQPWIRTDVLNDRAAALSLARDLRRRRQFSRIEIRRNIFDAEGGGMTDTVRVFHNHPRRLLRLFSRLRTLFR